MTLSAITEKNENATSLWIKQSREGKKGKVKDDDEEDSTGSGDGSLSSPIYAFRMGCHGLGRDG